MVVLGGGHHLMSEVPLHKVLDSRTTTLQNCEAVTRRARTQGSKTRVSLDSRLESHKEEEEYTPERRRGMGRGGCVRGPVQVRRSPAETHQIALFNSLDVSQELSGIGRHAVQIRGLENDNLLQF